MRVRSDGAALGQDVFADREAGSWLLFVARQRQGVGLACRKYVLAKRGVISSAALRKPGAALSRADIADVERLLARQEKRIAEIGA